MKIYSSDFKKVDTLPILKDVIRLRRDVYVQQYPKVSFEQYDFFDYFSTIWFGCNNKGKVISTSRLVEDSQCGLPSEEYVAEHIKPMRIEGLKIAEFGRLINVDKSNRNMVSYHFRAAYLEALEKNVDVIIMVTSAKKKLFYSRVFGAKVICKNIGTSFGSDDIFALYAWVIKDTAEEFFHWTNLVKSHKLVS